MTDTKVTIIIPTYNRSTLLRICLESVLSQDYPNFRIIILDNASTDNTESIARSFADSRITYIRNKTNIGLFGNWNRALQINTSPYLTILPDDDVLLSGFIHTSVHNLDRHPDASFSAGIVRYIDIHGNPLHLQDAGEPQTNLLEGTQFLHQIAAGQVWMPHPAAVMMRSEMLSAAQSFHVPHSKQLFDMNLYIRLASQFDIALADKEVAQVRLHAGQYRESEFSAIEGAKQIAITAERTDAIAYLFRSQRAEDEGYRKWLAKNLFSLNKYRSELTRLLVPSLNLTWAEQQQIDAHDIASVIPSGDTFILVDNNMKFREFVLGRHALPFLEKNGLYWGNPSDDDIAIRELERMRQTGATFIVFSNHALWWFDHYPKFHDYLRSNFNCATEKENITAFDLR
jgi:glycosyltransferase involved in cell wall biosynthesis